MKCCNHLLILAVNMVAVACRGLLKCRDGNLQKYCACLPCLVAFLGFHSYNMFFHFFKCFLVTCFCCFFLGGGGGGRKYEHLRR